MKLKFIEHSEGSSVKGVFVRPDLRNRFQLFSYAQNWRLKNCIRGCPSERCTESSVCFSYFLNRSQLRCHCGIFFQIRFPMEVDWKVGGVIWIRRFINSDSSLITGSLLHLWFSKATLRFANSLWSSFFSSSSILFSARILLVFCDRAKKEKKDNYLRNNRCTSYDSFLFHFYS